MWGTRVIFFLQWTPKVAHGLVSCIEVIQSRFGRCGSVLLIHPKYRLGHPENYLFSSSNKYFLIQSIPKNIFLKFENRNTNVVSGKAWNASHISNLDVLSNKYQHGRHGYDLVRDRLCENSATTVRLHSLECNRTCFWDKNVNIEDITSFLTCCHVRPTGTALASDFHIGWLTIGKLICQGL